ncbi:COMM domain-containing protein 1 isoform X2 [Latimeria chalumnae]|uniref:COMM domain-containing protein 1 n=1 Tax=Latimeria chalumnae TaxID=7897 RepID=H3BEU8_LATCH|nr:PREDICTED: COMM domain-containing protein 1 [Latimeria chalumnae]|eukprot:XP_005989627.1 PREDICTED: COMM domain-containing protein 1 [Latimeria chalumnae]
MMADVESAKALSGLLNGIAQCNYYDNPDITEELLKNELYPDISLGQFRALQDKMKGMIKSIASADMDLNQLEAFLTAQTKKQGGITAEQAAVIAKFWKNHKARIRESLISQSRWENTLRNLNWRVDLKTQSRHMDQINTPVAIVEMELGKHGQESEFVCLEFDEAKVNHVVKKLTEIEGSISAFTHSS